jgi:galactokinase
VLAAAFANAFGSSPDLVVAAPGRVNLVGEHTDYSFLPVLPIAIERRLLVAAASADDGIRAMSVSQAGTTEVGAAHTPGWGRYLAGATAMLGQLAEGRGARLAIGGDLPATGGLSSSSALTLGLLWALNRVWDLRLDRRQVVDLAIEAERLVGVESGGMDQTVIAFARPGHALRIDFAPEGRRDVPVAPEFAFVIGYSGSPAPKGTTARDGYNRAVVSCRAAAVLLAGSLGRDPGAVGRLNEVADAPVGAIDVLPTETTAAVAATAAGVEVGQLVSLTAATFDPHEPLFPRAAARHVLSEAARVDTAEFCLRGKDGGGLGAVFDESHSSLRQYGVSTPALDRLTAAARQGGAWGARLTGAGFGGWAVAVCEPGSRAKVVEAMRVATGGPAFPVRPSAGILDWKP